MLYQYIVGKDNYMKEKKGILEEESDDGKKEEENAKEDKTDQERSVKNDDLEDRENNDSADKKIENNDSADKNIDTSEENIIIDDFIVKHLPEFETIMSGIPQENVDKVQNWLKDKLKTGIDQAKALDDEERKEKENTKEKLKQKYGDNFEDVKRSAFSLLPEGVEVDSKKEFETIEKLYETYRKIEIKPPIKSNNYKPNFWEKGNPFLDSTHPDHGRVMKEYLGGV